VYLASWTGWLVTPGRLGAPLGRPTTPSRGWPRSCPARCAACGTITWSPTGSTPRSTRRTLGVESADLAADAQADALLSHDHRVRRGRLHRPLRLCGHRLVDREPAHLVAAGLATLVVLGWLAWRRDWRAGLIITGVAGGWLPWLLYLNRTVFFFYAVAWEPFLVLALVAALRLLEPDGADDSARACADGGGRGPRRSRSSPSPCSSPPGSTRCGPGRRSPATSGRCTRGCRRAGCDPGVGRTRRTARFAARGPPRRPDPTTAPGRGIPTATVVRT
jgi:hypothetical protein